MLTNLVPVEAEVIMTFKESLCWPPEVDDLTFLFVTDAPGKPDQRLTLADLNLVLHLEIRPKPAPSTFCRLKYHNKV
jgi:hypothetical protein